MTSITRASHLNNDYKAFAYARSLSQYEAKIKNDQYQAKDLEIENIVCTLPTLIWQMVQIISLKIS